MAQNHELQYVDFDQISQQLIKSKILIETWSAKLSMQLQGRV